jgi:hypothetical protein
MLSVNLSGETERGEYHPASKWQAVFKIFLVRVIQVQVASTDTVKKRPHPTACHRRFGLACLSNLVVAPFRERPCEQPFSESTAEFFRRLNAPAPFVQ